jgi:hypothetical protein
MTRFLRYFRPEILPGRVLFSEIPCQGVRASHHRWAEQQGGGGARTGDPANRREVAPALCRAGLDGLHDEPRPGVPREIDDAKVESVIVHTLESRSPGATHWNTRSMARHSGISTSKRRADLACRRAAAAPPRDFQAVH